MRHIYLDANSTTRLLPEVLRAMLDSYEAGFVNPASQHQPGQTARRRLEQARQSICDRLNAGPHDRLVFTSGGTESNNLALIGLSGSVIPVDDSTGNGDRPNVIISSIEHPAVLGAAEYLQSNGFQIHRLPCDSTGQTRLDQLDELINTETRLVSLMLANNETGVIQNVAKAARICRDREVLMHCDAVQGIGKIPVDFQELGVSALTMTAHKIHGPRGIGGLLLAKGIEPRPIMYGGFQQLGWRPGTEDVTLAIGFAKAIEMTVDHVDDRAKKLRSLRDLFEATILAELPMTVINGGDAERLAHTSNLSFPGDDQFRTVNRQALMMAVDSAGVAISTGSACASGSSEPSHVLTSMGCNEQLIESSIRVSFCTQTTESEAIEGARRIINAVKSLRQRKSVRK